VHEQPIGIFDSGVGGLSILKQVLTMLPHEDVLFLADQAHIPYGPRPLLEVRAFAHGVTRFLLQNDVKLIIVACNTASAAALHDLRATFPTVPLVGMEPAVKPAAKSTRSNVVGVLATPATFQGELFASVVERFANDVVVLEQILPNLVERIETGDLDGPKTRAILERAVHPLIEQRADTLVLACTHYPFIIPLLSEIVGSNIEVIDPSPAIARQAGRILKQECIEASPNRSGKVTYFTTGDPTEFSFSLKNLIGQHGEILALKWEAGDLSTC
jgi:glutamate racemase